MKRLTLILGILLMASSSFAGELHGQYFNDCSATKESDTFQSLDVLLNDGAEVLVTIGRAAALKDKKLEAPIDIENGAMIVLKTESGVKIGVSGLKVTVSATGVRMEAPVEGERSTDIFALETTFRKTVDAKTMALSLTITSVSNNDPKDEPRVEVMNFICQMK